MRVGCLRCSLRSHQTASQSIFSLSISLTSYEGSLMFQAFKYPWRMPCGSLCHVKFLNFSLALMLFSMGPAVLWGEQTSKTCKHKNYWPTTLLKVYEMLSVPFAQLVPWPHNISGLFRLQRVPEKGFIHPLFFIYLLSCLWFWNPALNETTLFVYILELWYEPI